MAGMIKCPACGKDIASNASKCPHCGFSFAGINAKAGCLTALLVGGFFLLLIIIMAAVNSH